MARRRRSFFFDNINKRLLANTTKNVKESKQEVDNNTVTNTDFLKKEQIDSDISNSIANLVNSAPSTLDTLDELAAALGDDANFATTTATSLGNRLRIDTNAQGLTATQKTNAKTNLGLSTVATSGAYSDLTGTPTIPTNNNQLTNGAGYITGITSSNVTTALGYTPANYDHFRHTGTGHYTSTTTSALLTEALGDDAFDSYLTAHKTGWSYAGNGNLTDAGRLTELAGTSWLWWTDNSANNTQGNITALCIAPTTGGSAGKVFIYNNQGSGYSPGWREVWTSTSDGSGSGLDADLLDGIQASSFLRSDANDTATGGLTFTGTVLSSGYSSGDNWLPFTDGKFYFRAACLFDNTVEFNNTIYINDSNTSLSEGSGNSVRITTNSGYVDVGAMNTSFCHFQTDRAKFYFNNRVDFDGDIYKYNTNTRLTDNALVLEGSAPTVYYRDTNHNVAMHHCNSNLMYTLRGATNTESWTTVNGQWPFIVNLSNNDCSVGGSLTAVGNITAYSSDERLKENITPIPDALSKVMQLKGCTFDWKDIVDDLGFTPDQRTGDVGLIAQDMEKVLPALVVPAPFDMKSPEPESEEDQSQVMKESKSGENYKTIQYEKVCALLIEAIKEQQEQIEELKRLIN